VVLVLKKTIFIIIIFLVFGGLITVCSRQEPFTDEKIELTEEELTKRIEEFDAVKRRLSIERRNRIRQERISAENIQQAIPETKWQHTENYFDYHDILESRRLIEEEKKIRKYRE